MELQNPILPWSKCAKRKVSALAEPTGMAGSVMEPDPSFTVKGGAVPGALETGGKVFAFIDIWLNWLKL